MIVNETNLWMKVTVEISSHIPLTLSLPFTFHFPSLPFTFSRQQASGSFKRETNLWRKMIGEISSYIPLTLSLYHSLYASPLFLSLLPCSSLNSRSPSFSYLSYHSCRNYHVDETNLWAKLTLIETNLWMKIIVEIRGTFYALTTTYRSSGVLQLLLSSSVLVF